MTDPSPILVSTVIPTRNRADLLGVAIESALSQSVPGVHEVVVVDDGSTDHTASVLARYPQVIALAVESGKPSRTRNAGIAAARGEYIAFLDDDDLWLPDRLAPAIRILQSDATAGMVYGQAQLVGPDLAEPGHSFPALPLAEGHPVGDFLDTVVHLNTVMVRRSVFDTVGMLDETVFAAEDMDITVRIARRFRVRALQRVLAMIHTRPTDETAQTGQVAHWIERAGDDIAILRSHLAVRDEHRPPAMRRARILYRRRGWYAHHLLRCAQAAQAAGLHGAARAGAAAALRLSPPHALRRASLYRALLAF